MNDDEESGEAHAREDDPDTAHDAAAFVEGAVATRQENLVLWMLEGAWPDGLTSFELAARAGVLRDSISPRFCPLARKRLIHDSGERRAKASGGPRSIVWKHGPSPETTPPETNRSMLTAFYHVGGANHWREVVSEQLRLLGTAKFPGLVHVHYGGDPSEQWFIWRVAETYGLQVTFLPNQPGREEVPVLEAIKDYVHSCDTLENILYFHTKGVGNPNSWRHVMWRWMMNKYILVDWERALTVLANGNYDWVGPQCFGPPLTHSAGGFWLATSEHLRRLEDFKAYHSTFMSRYGGAGAPHWLAQRHASEMWLGSTDPQSYKSLMPDPQPVELSNHASWCANIEAQLYATRHGS